MFSSSIRVDLIEAESRTAVYQSLGRVSGTGLVRGWLRDIGCIGRRNNFECSTALLDDYD
jgi:hypothetical protein